MGNFDISVSFSNLNVAEEIKRKVESGIDDSTKEIADTVIDTAQNRIRGRQAVYTGELLESFPWAVVTRGDDRYVRVWNSAPNAKFQEWGVRGVEGGGGRYQYTTKKPPIEPLIPWVQTKLGGLTLDPSGQRLVPADD